MEKFMSCCGVICGECEYYPDECRGCGESKGKVFWLEYTGGDVCEIYDCCKHKKRYEHCGQCSELPCSRYDQDDPTKTEQENQSDHKKQMENLKNRI